MSFSLGIVGLPNVGKSTLFQALTKNKVEASNYPFCTIDPNVGVVAVPDERLEKLAVMSQSKKIVYTTIEFLDIAGLVKGASQGAGLGNKFLSNIKETDAIVQVIRAFKNPDVTHVQGEINPDSDKEIINIELILADMDSVANRLNKLDKQSKAGLDKNEALEYSALKKIKEKLDSNQLAAAAELNPEEKKSIKSLNLLTLKPMLYVLNVDEEQIKIKEPLPDDTIKICAKVESELADLSATDRTEYLKEFNLQASGLDDLITASYKLLNLITFLTTGEQESRAWTIVRGALAPQAAGVIHTDFEKGFIRAEVINWQELLQAGSWTKAKELGKVRMEGKNYSFQDGDTVIFHHAN